MLKYGSIGKNVLGLEVVLANGTILNMIKRFDKDNSGYNLNSLFIGSEGTLGIITKVCLKLIIQPIITNVLLIKLENFSYVSKLLMNARKELGEILTAFEFMDKNSLSVMNQQNSQYFNR